MAGFVGAVAGVVGSPIYLSGWNTGLTLGLKGFIAATLGGLVSFRVAMAGGLLLGVLENLVAGYVSSGYRDAVAFVVLIVVLLVPALGAGRRQLLGGARVTILRRAVPFVILAVLLAVFPLVAPQQMVDAGVYALIYAIAAIGLSLLMGLAGQVSLGQAAFFAIGAYTHAMLLTKTQVPGPLSAVIAVLAAMLVALPRRAAPAAAARSLSRPGDPWPRASSSASSCASSRSPAPHPASTASRLWRSGAACTTRRRSSSGC